jgi:outer membrane protein OmpA-like peptidoglycan-associated protein
MLKTFSQILLFIFMLMPVQKIISQQAEHEPSSKVRRAFDTALDHWNEKRILKAEKELRTVIKLDSLYIEPYVLLGDVLLEQGKTTEAISMYKAALRIDSTFSSSIYYLLAKSCLETDDPAASCIWLELYLDFEDIRESSRKNAEDMLVTARFRKNAIRNPVLFEPVNLGNMINSPDDEFINSVTLDEQKMVWTLMKPDSIIRGKFTEEFVMAEKIDSAWVITKRALPELHSLGNIGAMSLSPDGKFLFFTSCGTPGGFGSCDLYVCGKKGDSWSKPQNLGKTINAESWDSQPCFSADGQTLFFSSSRAGGLGGSDIWHSTFIQNQGWTKPVNAGTEINTDKEEMAPFIHPDGKTMYFSSKGHPGMGGFDLFVSRRDSTAKWLKPENLGWPVNTSSDEINIIVSVNGKHAYLSSDIEAGHGGYDIYRFELPSGLAPNKVTYLQGHVYDADSLFPLQAEIQLIDLESGDLTVRCKSDPVSGIYIAALPGGRNYALNISKIGYLFYSENFNLAINATPEDPVKMDVYLQAVKTGESLILNNIFFDTDKYVLKELSLVELYKLHAFMVQNSEINILICGHTDDVGTVAYNLDLSEKRAAAVYFFLIEAGISPERMKYQGFGKSQAVEENDTEEGRAKNRRTEILIL